MHAGHLPVDGGRLNQNRESAMADTGPSGISLAQVVQRGPDIHSGDLVFTGTRVRLDNLVSYLKGGRTIQEFLQDYPTVERWNLESYLDLSPHGLDHMRTRIASAP